MRSGKLVKYEVAGTNMNITQHLLSCSFPSNMLSIFFLPFNPNVFGRFWILCFLASLQEALCIFAANVFQPVPSELCQQTFQTLSWQSVALSTLHTPRAQTRSLWGDDAEVHSGRGLFIIQQPAFTAASQLHNTHVHTHIQKKDSVCV